MPLTTEERRKLFVEAYNTLVRQYGVGLEAKLQTEKLGEALLTKPVIAAVAIPDWQPEAEVKIDKERESGLDSLSD